MMSTAPRFTGLVDGLPSTIPFVGPETLERQRGETFRVRVGANESAFGVSPKAAEAMREAIETIAWYNDPEAYEVRSAIAGLHGVSVDEVLLGAGIDEMLGNVVRMVIEPGMPVVTSLGAYPTFNYHVAGFGGVLEAVPYRDDRIDLEALLDAVRRVGAPLVFLANPDNPMGTWHDAGRGAGIHRRAAGIDAAHPRRGIHRLCARIGGVPDRRGRPRVIRMRTFSKAHGMAGARIGYAIAPSRTIGGLGRHPQPLRSEPHRADRRAGLARRPRVHRLGGRGGAPAGATSTTRSRNGSGCPRCSRRRTSWPSTPAATATTPAPCWRELQDEGVFVRMPGVAPLDRCIRVTVGTAEERALFADIFEAVVNV